MAPAGSPEVMGWSTFCVSKRSGRATDLLGCSSAVAIATSMTRDRLSVSCRILDSLFVWPFRTFVGLAIPLAIARLFQRRVDAHHEQRNHRIEIEAGVHHGSIAK